MRAVGLSKKGTDRERSASGTASPEIRELSAPRWKVGIVLWCAAGRENSPRKFQLQNVIEILPFARSERKDDLAFHWFGSHDE